MVGFKSVCASALVLGSMSAAQAEGFGDPLAPLVGLGDIVVPSPCPGPGCNPPDDYDPLAQGLRKVFVNFNSVTLTRDTTWEDSRDNTSLILITSSKTLPGLRISDPSDTGGMSLTAIKNAIIERMYILYAPYEVEFVTTRPSSGNYHMIVFGSTCSSVAGSDCAGISLRDCTDYMANNVSFVFPTDMRLDDIATTAAHEVGHALGLAHTSDTDDVMYPTILWSLPDGFGAGSVPDDGGGCGGASYQDSHGVLLDTIGDRGADFEKPVVNITSPNDGATVTPGSFIGVTVTDNFVVDRVELILGGSKVAEKTSAPYQFIIPTPTPDGPLPITIYAYDLSNNLGVDRVDVTVDRGAPECLNNSHCAEEEHCADEVCVPDEDPAPGELGSECASNNECATEMCATVADVSRCTQSCAADTECPEGFECKGGAACWPVEEKEEEPEEVPMCGIAGDYSTPTLLFLLGIIALASRRRGRGRP